MADDDTSTAPVFDMMTDAERLVAVTRELAAAQVEAATYKERAKSLKEQIKIFNKKPAQPVQGGNTMATSNNTPAQPAAASAAPTPAPTVVTTPASVPVGGPVIINVMPASPMVPVAAPRSGALLALAFSLCVIVIIVLAGLVASKYGFSIGGLSDTPKAAEVAPPPADTKAGDPPAAKADEAKAADEATTPPKDGDKVDAASEQVDLQINCTELRAKGPEGFVKNSMDFWAALERCPTAKQAPPASSDTPPASADPAEVPKATNVDYNILSGNTFIIQGASNCPNQDGCCAAKKGCEKKVDEPPPAKKATCCQARPPKPKKKQVVVQEPINDCVAVPPSQGSGEYVVFVPNAAAARCLVGAQKCKKCTNWARNNGLPGFTAYRISSASALLLPVGASNVWFCYGGSPTFKMRLV